METCLNQLFFCVYIYLIFNFANHSSTQTDTVNRCSEIIRKIFFFLFLFSFQMLNDDRGYMFRAQFGLALVHESFSLRISL